MVPMELLKIAAKQRYQKKLGDQQLATLIRSAARPADERQREIEQWVQEANVNQDPVSFLKKCLFLTEMLVLVPKTTIFDHFRRFPDN